MVVMDPTASGSNDESVPSTARGPAPYAQTLVGGSSDAPDDDDDLVLAKVRQRLLTESPRATQIARFTILEPIGRGGMGSIYAAYDPQLDRKIAVKVLREDELPGAGDRARFLREAQALARLSHPNVVTVHDAGDTDGRLFLAMEFIHGENLSQWLRAEPGWRAALEAYIQAGRGLAAAHQAGLVHRDLKPHNIMRRDDGVVKLLDFGLARAIHEALDHSTDAGSSADLGVSGVSPSSLSDMLTSPGVVMGTPAYMSPEQFAGEVVDERSDQFSFCVALYEAVYGERPFLGSTMSALMDSVHRERVRPAPKDRAVPARLRTVLLRGLAYDPADRWPSMEAVLEQLRPLLGPRRRRLALGLGVVLGLGVLGAVQAYTTGADQRCTGAAAQLDGVWDEGRRQAVEASLLGTGLPFAQQTWARVEGRLDEYAEAWTRKHTEVCEATAVRREQSEAVMEQRMRCLGERRRALRALVGVLADADAKVVEAAVESAAELPVLLHCDDLQWLEQQEQRLPPPEDPGVAAEVEAQRERLADIWAMIEVGRYDQGLEQVEPVVQRAEALGYPPLVVEALAMRGDLWRRDSDLERAEQELRRAYAQAVQHRHDDVALRVARTLARMVGVRLARHAEGEQWARMEALPLALRGGDPAQIAASLETLGHLHHSQGEYEEAQDYCERALRRVEEARGAEHPEVLSALSCLGNTSSSLGNYEEAKKYHQRSLSVVNEALGVEHLSASMALGNLGGIAMDQGKYDEAGDYFQRSLEIVENALRPDHPRLASSLLNLGITRFRQEEYGDARSLFHQALVIHEKALGPDNPILINDLNNLGAVLSFLGEYEEATKHYERGIRIAERALGDSHPSLLASLTNLGKTYGMLGDYERAQEVSERSLVIAEQALGPEHPEVAMALTTLGGVLRSQGKYEEAREYHERALVIREEALGGDHPDVAEVLVVLAELSLEHGDASAARQHAERALSIYEAAAAVPEGLASARFVLAKALWPERSERARAQALAEQAREALAGAEGSAEADAEHAEVDEWLATRRVRSRDG